MAGLPEDLLAPPVNVLRASLHPDGLAPRIANLGQWKAHLLGGWPAQAARHRRPGAAHAATTSSTPIPRPSTDDDPAPAGDVVVPLRLRIPGGELRFFSTVTTFGTPVDITVEELSIESFFPADAATAEYLRRAV